MADLGQTNIIFAKLKISDSTTLLLCNGGWDIIYNSETYSHNSKILVEVGKTEQTLDSADNPMEISLNANESDALLTSANTRDYAYREAFIYKGDWDYTTNSIKNVKVLKGGFLDTHNDNDNNGVMTFLINSWNAVSARSRDDVNAEVSQKNRLVSGFYGESNKTATDTAFQNTSKKLEELGLGGTLAYSVPYWNGEGGKPGGIADDWFNDEPEYSETNYAATSAVRVSAGESSHSAVPYGETHVGSTLLDGKNPTESEVHSIYGSDWAGAVDHGDPAKKYLTLYLVVCHGEIDGLKMYSNHSSDTYTLLTSSGSDTQTTYITSGGKKIAAITTLRGTEDQTGFGSNAPSWRTSAKGIGHCMVAITLVAWSDWPAGLPRFTFVPSSIRIKTLSSSGVSATKSKSNKVGDVIYDYLTNKPYGLGLPAYAVDEESLYAANDLNSGLTVSIYPTTLVGAVAGPGSFRSFLQKMTDSSSTTLYEKSGKLALFVGKTITDSEVKKEFYGGSSLSVSNCEVSQKNARSRDIPNEATVKYFAIYNETGKSPVNLQQTVIVTDDDAFEEDKYFKSTISMNLDFLSGSGSISKVKEAANLLIRRERIGNQKLRISTDYINARDISLGDVIEVDEPRYKWTGVDARRYRVAGIEDDHTGRVTLMCSRFSNEIYKGVDNFSGTRVEQVAPTISSYDTTLTDNTPAVGAPGKDGIYEITVYKDSDDSPLASPVGGTPDLENFTLAVVPPGWALAPTPGTTAQRQKSLTIINPTLISGSDKKEKATFTEDSGITGGSISSAIAQVNTTLYNSGTSGNASGSTTVAEEVFFDIAGNFPAADYGTTRDSLKATFSVGAETEFTFDNVDSEPGSYTFTPNGFTYPIASSDFNNIFSGDVGFTVDGNVYDFISIGINTANAAIRQNQIVRSFSFGLPLLDYTSTTATTDLELATEAAAAFAALSATTGTTVPGKSASSTTTYNVVRTVDVTRDGSAIKFEQIESDFFTPPSLGGTSGQSSTLTSVAGVQQPRNDGYLLKPDGFSFSNPSTIRRTGVLSSVATEMGVTVAGQSPVRIWIGYTTNSTPRKNEICFDSSDNSLVFYSSTSTSIFNLVGQAAAAYQALAVNGVGTTTINALDSGSSTTYAASRTADFLNVGGAFTVTQRATGSFADVTVENDNGPTSTVENLPYVAAPGKEYFDLFLDGFTFSGQNIAGYSVDSSLFSLSGDTLGFMVIGHTAFASVRQDEIVFNGNQLFYYSTTATTEAELVAEAVTAFSAISDSTGTTINHQQISNSSTNVCIRNCTVTGSFDTLRFTYNTFGNKTDAVATGVPTGTTITNVDGGAAISLADYSTTALVADRIVSQGYEGLTLTVDNTYDIIANPLGTGDVRIKGVYDALGTQTDVTSASFVIVQGTDGTLTLEGVGIATQGGGVTHVGDTLALTNVDTNNGHSASAASVTLSNDITGNTVRDVIDTLWTGLGGFTIDKTTTGTVLATDTAAGDSSDPVLVHTPGTGSTLVISSSVTTDGVDGGLATGTNTNTTTVAGVDYLTVFGVGIGGSARATAVYNTLNAASAVTDDYDLVIDGDTWSIERKIFGNQTNVLSVIDTGKLNQTAVDPTVVRIEGINTTLVWTTPVFDGVDGSQGNTPSYQYWYTISAGLRSEIGDPDTPGTGVTWVDNGTSNLFPNTAFWYTLQITIGSSVGAYQVTQLRTKDAGIPFVKHDITRTTPALPTLGDAQWILDAIAAVEVFTGRTYSDQKEFGYGTTVVIDYNISGTETTLAGTFKLDTSTDPDSDVWVAPGTFIDGDLVVDGSIIGDKIAANSITGSRVNLVAGDVNAGSTANSGARLNLTSNSIKFYNSGGDLVVNIEVT